jgi:tetratricopeptide (TPR) repeat protein
MDNPVSRNLRSTLRFNASVVGLVLAILTSAALAQAPKPKETEPEPVPPGLRLLQGEEAKRADELDAAAKAAMKADRWDEAVTCQEALIALRSRVQGPKHYETAKEKWHLETLRRVATMPNEDRVAYLLAVTVNEQAQDLFAQGKYAQAQPLFESALEIRRRLLTDDDSQTAYSYIWLAANLNAQRKYALAQPVYEKALEINRRLLTDDHPQTADCYANVANNLSAQGKFDLAQTPNERALEIRRRLLTDNHPETAKSYNNLAANLHSLGKHALAQPFYEKALDFQLRALTDNHPETASTLSNLAVNLDEQGKHAQAQPLHEKALEIKRRLLTDDHPSTAHSYSNLAGNLYIQGKYAQAQPLMEKALVNFRRAFTDDHPKTATCYNNLAQNLDALGQFAQAQPLHERALEITRRLRTDDHPDTAIRYENLADNLDAQGKCAQAQPLHERALVNFRRAFTDDSYKTAVSYTGLAGNLDDQGQHSQAQPLHERALEITRRLRTDDHPDTARCYNSLAVNLQAQGKYAQAQPLFEKALVSFRRAFTDDKPNTAVFYVNWASNLDAQGKYSQAQPLHERALEICHLLLTDVHPVTARSYRALAANLNAQGKYAAARDQWLSAVKSLDAARLRIAFAGLERTGNLKSSRADLSAIMARLGQTIEAWQALEGDLGRGLLDELAARSDQRLTPAERDQLRELTAALERLDRLVEAIPKALDQAERAKQFAELSQQRDLASIALGEFQTKLVQDHEVLASPIAGLGEVQGALSGDAAMIAWVDIPPIGPNAADPHGEHWGVVVRSRGVPAWVSIDGTDPDGLWSEDDTGLANRVRTELRRRPDGDSTALRRLVDKMRTQRLEPLAKALGATADGLPTAQRLIILPSRAMAGIPIEALLCNEDTRTVSYSPSATVFRYLRGQPRPDPHAGLLALGDPVYGQPDKSNDPEPPVRGLLVNRVMPDSNAATRGLQPGDVLLSYNGKELHKREDLKAVLEPGRTVPIEFWRNGTVARLELAPGQLGVGIDSKPAPLAIVEERNFRQVLAMARGSVGAFAPLPGTRHEVEEIAQLFQDDGRLPHILLGSDASEPELDRLAALGELRRFGVIHLATHGVIDERTPARSALILTQVGLPDPLDQVLKNKPVFDGRLLVREIQRSWELKAELVTLSACETAMGRESGGEGFVGFTQALLMSGARSVCLSLWEVNDRATSLLMTRFYQNWLGKRPGLVDKPMPKAEALREAKQWLKELTDDKVKAALASRGVQARGGQPNEAHPYAHPYYWAGFILVGDPD